MLRTSMRVEESLKQVCYHLCSSAPFIYSEVSIQARYIYGDWVNWIVELAGDTTIRSVAWRRRYSDRPWSKQGLVRPSKQRRQDHENVPRNVACFDSGRDWWKRRSRFCRYHSLAWRAHCRGNSSCRTIAWDFPCWHRETSISSTYDSETITSFLSLWI